MPPECRYISSTVHAFALRNAVNFVVTAMRTSDVKISQSPLSNDMYQTVEQFKKRFLELKRLRDFFQTRWQHFTLYVENVCFLAPVSKVMEVSYGEKELLGTLLLFESVFAA